MNSNFTLSKDDLFYLYKSEGFNFVGFEQYEEDELIPTWIME
jgi:hypothetical protein